MWKCKSVKNLELTDDYQDVDELVRIEVADIIKAVWSLCPSGNGAKTLEIYKQLTVPMTNKQGAVGPGSSSQLDADMSEKQSKPSTRWWGFPILNAVTSAIKYVDNTMDDAVKSGFPPSPVSNTKTNTSVRVKPDQSNPMQAVNVYNMYDVVMNPHAAHNAKELSSFLNQIGVLSAEDLTYLDLDDIFAIATMLKPVQKKKFLQYFQISNKDT